MAGWHAHVFMGMCVSPWPDGTCPRRRGHATRPGQPSPRRPTDLIKKAVFGTATVVGWKGNYLGQSLEPLNYIHEINVGCNVSEKHRRPRFQSIGAFSGVLGQPLFRAGLRRALRAASGDRLNARRMAPIERGPCVVRMP